MVYPVYEPPALSLTAAQADATEHAAQALADKLTAGGTPDAPALAAGCRALPLGYSRAGSELVRQWGRSGVRTHVLRDAGTPQTGHGPRRLLWLACRGGCDAACATS